MQATVVRRAEHAWREPVEFHVWDMVNVGTVDDRPLESRRERRASLLGRTRLRYTRRVERRTVRTLEQVEAYYRRGIR